MSPDIGSILLAAGAVVLLLTAAYQGVQREFDGVFFLSVTLCCVFAAGFVAF
jgi:hypothetical protein